MKLTNKCLKAFEKWYVDQDDCWAVNLIAKRDGEWNTHTEVTFNRLSKSMKFGVFVDFFNSVGIYPQISNESYIDGVNVLWQVFEYDPKTPDCWSNKSTGLYGDNGEYTRQEAREQAIIKANEIYNKQ